MVPTQQHPFLHASTERMINRYNEEMSLVEAGKSSPSVTQREEMIQELLLPNSHAGSARAVWRGRCLLKMGETFSFHWLKPAAVGLWRRSWEPKSFCVSELRSSAQTPQYFPLPAHPVALCYHNPRNRREAEKSRAHLFTPLGTTTEDSQSLSQFVLPGYRLLFRAELLAGWRNALLEG